MTIELSEIPGVACEAVRSAYPDCPSVGRLMVEAAAVHYIWRSAAERPGSHSSGYITEHKRLYWLLHGAALDIIALQSDQDPHSADQAARAGQEVYGLDTGWRTLNSTVARAYLRDAYQDLRTGIRHPWNCEGGCGGAGWTMQVLIEEYQGPGLWHPVHEEPVDCDRGLDLPHAIDCPGACQGTGWVIASNENGSPRERGRCTGQPLPDAAALPRPLPDWDEPPF